MLLHYMKPGNWVMPITDLCKDLNTLESAKFEGVLQEFANYAFSLRYVLECLLSSGISCATNAKVDEGFCKMGMITSSNDDPSYQKAEIPLASTVGDSAGISKDRKNNDNILNLDSKKYAEASVTTDPVPSYVGDVSHPIPLQGDCDQTPESCKSQTNLRNDEKLIPIEGSDVSDMFKNKKEYHVDILRSESLASLPPAALDHLFLCDYGLVVSILPLPQSSVLPGPSDPAHFGPPTYSSMTPWMKLVLYSTVASGPLSVVLMKSQCLRLLPAPLAGCEKALIWSWDGSTVGGLGGKLEGNLVKGNTLLPLKNSDGSVAPVEKEFGPCEEEILKLKPLLTDLANKMEL